MRVSVMLAALPLLCAISTAQPPGNPRSPYGIYPGNIGGAGGIDRARGIAGESYSGSLESGVFFTGRVLLSDGSVPSERIAVQRVCGMSVVQETFTDSKGRFSLQVGSNRFYAPDEGVDEAPRTGGFSGSAPQAPGGALENCELRAALPGYRSDTISLADRRQMDNPNVGTMILHRVWNAKGLTVSATTALAPKQAREDYEKGMDAIRHRQPDRAQKDFKLAVRLYPRFAAAWFQLGEDYENRKDLPKAREAYAKAITADAGYLNPYERVYLMDLNESRWKEAADGSERVLRLNPYDFPGAFYVNAVANLELNKLDKAEESARESAALKGSQAEPRANYVLGFILAQKGEFPAAAEKLRIFLKMAPAGRDRSAAEKMLAEVERRQQRAGGNPAHP